MLEKEEDLLSALLEDWKAGSLDETTGLWVLFSRDIASSSMTISGVPPPAHEKSTKDANGKAARRLFFMGSLRF